MTGTRPLRADAARNREKLLATAGQLFSERGLDVPMEHIARRAEVSIGTLYAHFPTREAFFAAIFPQRLAALDTLAERAGAEPDPWRAFVGYLEGLFALHARDRGLNDVLVRQLAVEGVAQACHRGAEHLDDLIRRAQDGGRLRPDFTMADMATLTRAVAQIIRDATDDAPAEVGRFLEIYVAGLRTTP
ncbi:TetR/AcrR family transcriptional regulator [Actinophytocola sp.]|uniref:TetR/AcrR family transcriptional regulator n=1 Tax=Actinophytocola sp. TaxID=1872138 RepID=UPI00389A240D